MGIIDRLAARLGYIKRSPDLQAPAFLRADAAMARYAIPDGSLAHNQADLYLRLSWVQTAVQVVAQIAAGTSFSVKQRAGDQLRDIPNHHFETLLSRPNPLHSRFEFLEATFAYRLLTGNAYWWLNRAGPDAEPSEIWVIPPDKIMPVPDGQSYLKGYMFFPEGITGGVSATGAGWPLDPWEIVHFKRFHPLNSFVGLSPIEALATAAVGDLNAQQWNANFFGKDNAKLEGALAFADMVNNADWETIKTDVRSQWGGTKRSGPMLLRGVGVGGVNWLQMGLSQTDMQFLAGRQFTKEEIYGLFAPGLSSVLDVNATEANATSGRATLIDLTVWPALCAVAEKISNNLLPCYPGDLVGAFDDIRWSDRELELKEQEAYERVHTIDEVRQKYYAAPPIGDCRGRWLASDRREQGTGNREQGSGVDGQGSVVEGEVIKALPCDCGCEEGAAVGTHSGVPLLKAELRADESALIAALIAVVRAAGDHLSTDLLAATLRPFVAATAQRTVDEALRALQLDNLVASGPVSGERVDLRINPPVSAWVAELTDDLAADLFALLVERGAARKSEEPGWEEDIIGWVIRAVVRLMAWVMEALQRLLNGGPQAIPGFEWVRVWRTALDERVCPVCEPLEGVPEDFWAGCFEGPPAHMRCRCFLRLERIDPDTGILIPGAVSDWDAWDPLFGSTVKADDLAAPTQVGNVAIVGSRDLPASARPLIDAVIAALLGRGRQIGTGDASGLDEQVIQSTLALNASGSLHIFAAQGPAGRGAWRCSAKQIDQAAQRGAYVQYWAGGQGGTLRQRLVQRTIQVVDWAVGGGPGSGLIAFVTSMAPSGCRPASHWVSCGSGTWGAAALAVGRGTPLVAFPYGGGRAWLPDWPGGSWEVAGGGVWAQGWKWMPWPSGPGTITVANCKTTPNRNARGHVYIGRPSPLGNPYKIGPDGTRDEVIAKYAAWLPTDPAAQAEISALSNRLRNGEDLTLLCWCSPLPCHGDVVKEAIENRLGRGSM
jgi:HK97 family phage portal protein